MWCRLLLYFPGNKQQCGTHFVGVFKNNASITQTSSNFFDTERPKEKVCGNFNSEL